MKTRTRHWPEAIVGVLGALPAVVIWLHLYSNTPSRYPEPTYAHTVALVLVAVIGTVVSAWLLRARLRLPWVVLVAVALAGPVLLAASGVIRSRAEQWPGVLPPILGAWGAAVAYLVGAILIAAIRVRRRLVAAAVPLGLAVALGHVAYGLPAQMQYDIARTTGYPWPNETASDLLYGHALPS